MVRSRNSEGEEGEGVVERPLHMPACTAEQQLAAVQPCRQPHLGTGAARARKVVDCGGPGPKVDAGSRVQQHKVAEFGADERVGLVDGSAHLRDASKHMCTAAAPPLAHVAAAMERACAPCCAASNTQPFQPRLRPVSCQDPAGCPARLTVLFCRARLTRVSTRLTAISESRPAAVQQQYTNSTIPQSASAAATPKEALPRPTLSRAAATIHRLLDQAKLQAHRLTQRPGRLT